MPEYQHIVVGGGISGMTAALILGREGRKVALVEAFPSLAPTARGFKRKDAHFETGIHLLGGLGDNHPLDIYFKHLGISDELTKIPFDQDGYDCFRFTQSGRQINMPFGYENLQKKLCAEFPKEKSAIESYLSKIKATFEQSPFLNFEREFSLEAAVHADTSTLQKYLDSITSDQNLKDLLSYHTLLYGAAPKEAMLSTHALVAGSYFMSSHAIEGGGTAIVKAFQKQLTNAGVEILTRKKVTQIKHGPEREFESVILSDGTQLKAESCIWTGHPATMIECADEGAFRPIFKRRIKELNETVSALILFGVAGNPLPELTRKNLYLWPDGNYSDMLSGRSKIEDSAIFVSASQTLEKTKQHAFTAIMPYGFEHFKDWTDSKLHNRPQEYKNFKVKLAEEFKQEFFKRCPEMAGRIEFIDCATPLTLRDYCSSPYGSMYGAAHTVSQYNPLPITKVKNLFLAGQSIIAPGVLGAVVSAYLTCGIVCGHDKIHKELRCIYKG